MSAQADHQRQAIDEAVEVLTKRLREWAATPPDQREPADVLARRFITDMNGHGWRKAAPPRPTSWQPVAADAWSHAGQAAQAASSRGADLARSLLPHRQHHDQDGPR
ncbi:hypothetical protein AB0392_50590 [Nonomuraea angiospora]|uniref:hypothetical protein n=1 Tax=Nonomuraea angiospora TaxID=46172 RepID=UPI00344BBBC1